MENRAVLPAVPSCGLSMEQPKLNLRPGSPLLTLISPSRSRPRRSVTFAPYCLCLLIRPFSSPLPRLRFLGVGPASVSSDFLRAPAYVRSRQEEGQELGRRGVIVGRFFMLLPLLFFASSSSSSPLILAQDCIASQHPCLGSARAALGVILFFAAVPPLALFTFPHRRQSPLGSSALLVFGCASLVASA